MWGLLTWAGIDNLDDVFSLVYCGCMHIVEACPSLCSSRVHDHFSSFSAFLFDHVTWAQTCASEHIFIIMNVQSLIACVSLLLLISILNNF